MAVKNTIYDNLINKLESIIEGGVYSTTVNDAYRILRGHIRGREQTPAVAIIENSEQLLVEDATNKRYLLGLTLYVEIEGRQTDIAAFMTNCERDIKLLFDAPIDLGTNVLYARIVSINSPVASENLQRAEFNAEIDITYYESKT